MGEVTTTTDFAAWHAGAVSVSARWDDPPSDPLDDIRRAFELDRPHQPLSIVLTTVEADRLADAFARLDTTARAALQQAERRLVRADLNLCRAPRRVRAAARSEAKQARAHLARVKDGADRAALMREQFNRAVRSADQSAVPWVTIDAACAGLSGSA